MLRALYDICKEVDPDVSWEVCRSILQTTPRFLEAAVPVILYTMDDFIKNEGFDFTAKPISLMDILDEDEPGDKDGVLRAVRLFSDDYGEGLVDLFLLNAEALFYNEQLKNGKIYTPEKYLAELEKNKPMWNILQNAFYDAVKRLDFRVGWLAEDLDEVQTLWGPALEET